MLSLILPLVEINVWQSAGGPAPQAIKLLQVVSTDEYLDEIVITVQRNNFTTEQALLLIYLATSIIFLGLFTCMLLRIRTLFVKHQHSLVGDIYFVNTTARGTPFSFLKYIFWNDHIDPESTTGNQIFKHELAHVQQKHSYDKLFINALLVFSWCNPFFWLIRKELNMIHEFIADKIAVEDSDTEAFAAMILQATYPRHNFQLTNPFFYSPIKRRLIMLTRNKHPKVGYIGRVLVLPLAIFVFAAFTIKTKTLNENRSAYNGKKITVVIDAGHGGNDLGAQSLVGNVAEKDITLSIIKMVKTSNNNPNINIVLTRETDVYQSPAEKAIFAKQQGADLFISVHTDGASQEKAAVSSGLSVWVAKENYGNSANSKVFASAIINEFSNVYKLPVIVNPQQRQAGIAVLQESTCPSVLIEVGYITNSNDLAYLQTTEAKKLIADKILAAVEKYAFAKEGKDGIAIRAVRVTENFPGEKADTIPSTEIKNIGKALVIIDGRTSSQTELKAVNAETIESVQVLKGTDAIAKYGDKGKNGVVIVTTKEVAFLLNDVNVNIEEDTSSEKMVLSGKVAIRNDRNPAAKLLFIIDGEIQENGMDINALPSDDIESITVLKDKKATEKYGDKAVQGAIEITTKSKKPIKKIPISGSQNNNTTDGIATVRYNNNQEVNAAYSSKTNPTELYVLRADLNIKQQEQPRDKIFTKTEFEPEFPGGDSAWKNYLMKNLQADMPLQEGWKPGIYKIVLTFIVKKDGSVMDVRADNYAGTKTAEHCVELLSKGPKWKPAIQNGHGVDCYKKQPLTFVVLDK